jgi:hypothetical protein
MQFNVKRHLVLTGGRIDARLIRYLKNRKSSWGTGSDGDHSKALQRVTGRSPKLQAVLRRKRPFSFRRFRRAAWRKVIVN